MKHTTKDFATIGLGLPFAEIEPTFTMEQVKQMIFIAHRTGWNDRPFKDYLRSKERVYNLIKEQLKIEL